MIKEMKVPQEHRKQTVSMDEEKEGGRRRECERPQGELSHVIFSLFWWRGACRVTGCRSQHWSLLKGTSAVWEAEYVDKVSKDGSGHCFWFPGWIHIPELTEGNRKSCDVLYVLTTKKAHPPILFFSQEGLLVAKIQVIIEINNRQGWLAFFLLSENIKSDTWPWHCPS